MKRKKVEERDIAKLLRQGYGRGEGSAFKPWQTIHDFSSRGNSHRIYSPKTKRTHQLFSNIERSLFLKAEFGETFQWYHEQHSMEREKTLAFAKLLGIEHPVYVGTKVVFVMTLDAVVVRKQQDGTLTRTGYDVKEVGALENKRTLEKLSISKMYCEHMGWDHKIVTNETIPRATIRNLEWIRSGAPKQGEVVSTYGLFDLHPQQMLEALARTHAALSVTEFCGEYDSTHGLRPGTGLRVFQLLLWTHRLTADLDGAPIHLQSTPQIALNDARLRVARAA